MIKYRIWDKEKEKFYEEDYRAYQGELEDLFIGPSGDLNMRKMKMGTTKFIHQSMFPNRFEVSLWTGLLDRFGTEIYGGDIILFKNRNMTSPELLGYFKYFGDKACWMCVETLDEGDHGAAYHEDCDDGVHDMYSVEVIGNIYENPGLLKQT